jgi:hypothetical protein
VPCPTCHKYNQIFFTPGGSLHHVAPADRRSRVPEPSLN